MHVLWILRETNTIDIAYNDSCAQYALIVFCWTASPDARVIKNGTRPKMTFPSAITIAYTDVYNFNIYNS